MANNDDKVVVAYCHPGLVHGAFMESVLDLLVYDMALHRRVVHGGGRLAVQAGANLAGPRNGLVKQFLAFGKADWLWMVDSDMTFPADTLERLLENADAEKAPIIGGLCFGFDDKGEVQPTLYGLDGDPDDPDHMSVVRFHEWPPDTMFQVAATGAACLLMHKSVLERMWARRFNDAFPWFQETQHDGSPVGEDITFCWRAAVLGVPVWVNTAVHLGHIKHRLLTMESYFLGRGLLSPQHSGAAV